MRRWSWPTMGSYASLAVAGASGLSRFSTPPRTTADARSSDLDDAVSEVREWLGIVESTLSPYRADSELWRWRTGQVPLAACSPLLSEVIDAVGELEDLTDGGFRPYDRQGRFDPTGYVKGWAVERAVRILREAGYMDASFGIGGDVQMIGRAEPGRPWRVAVTDPTDEHRIVAVVEAWADGRPFAVATSGSAQRGEHIWTAPGGGPGGSIPADSPASITVVGPDLGRVDAFATAIWALAQDRSIESAWKWLPDAGYDAMAVTMSGTIRTTSGMAGRMAGAAADR